MKTLIADELLELVDRRADVATEEIAMRMLWYLHDAVTELTCDWEDRRIKPEYPGERVNDLLDTLVKPEYPIHRLEAFRELVRELAWVEPDGKQTTGTDDLRAALDVKAEQIRVLQRGRRLAEEWMDVVDPGDAEAEKQLWEALADARIMDLNVAMEGYALRRTEDRIRDSEVQKTRVMELADGALTPAELEKLVDHLAAERETVETEMKKVKEYLRSQPTFSRGEALYECKAVETRESQPTVDAAGQKEKVREDRLIPVTEET